MAMASPGGVKLMVIPGRATSFEARMVQVVALAASTAAPLDVKAECAARIASDAHSAPPLHGFREVATEVENDAVVAATGGSRPCSEALLHVQRFLVSCVEVGADGRGGEQAAALADLATLALAEQARFTGLLGGHVALLHALLSRAAAGGPASRGRLPEDLATSVEETLARIAKAVATMGSSAPSSWTCAVCTNENSVDVDACRLCGHPRNPPPEEAGWPCPMCTLRNNPDATSCELCGAGRPDEFSPTPSPAPSPTPAAVSAEPDIRRFQPTYAFACAELTRQLRAASDAFQGARERGGAEAPFVRLVPFAVDGGAGATEEMAAVLKHALDAGGAGSDSGRSDGLGSEQMADTVEHVCALARANAAFMEPNAGTDALQDQLLAHLSALAASTDPRAGERVSALMGSVLSVVASQGIDKIVSLLRWASDGRASAVSSGQGSGGGREAIMAELVDALGRAFASGRRADDPDGAASALVDVARSEYTRVHAAVAIAADSWVVADRAAASEALMNVPMAPLMARYCGTWLYERNRIVTVQACCRCIHMLAVLASADARSGDTHSIRMKDSVMYCATFGVDPSADPGLLVASLRLLGAMVLGVDCDEYAMAAAATTGPAVAAAGDPSSSIVPPIIVAQLEAVRNKLVINGIYAAVMGARAEPLAPHYAWLAMALMRAVIGEFEIRRRKVPETRLWAPPPRKLVMRLGSSAAMPQASVLLPSRGVFKKRHTMLVYRPTPAETDDAPFRSLGDMGTLEEEKWLGADVVGAGPCVLVSDDRAFDAWQARKAQRAEEEDTAKGKGPAGLAAAAAGAGAAGGGAYGDSSGSGSDGGGGGGGRRRLYEMGISARRAWVGEGGEASGGAVPFRAPGGAAAAAGSGRGAFSSAGRGRGHGDGGGGESKGRGSSGAGDGDAEEASDPTVPFYDDAAPNLLADPLGYERVATLQNTDGKVCGVWLPTGPPGYVALGCAIELGDSPPPLKAVACVHISATADFRAFQSAFPVEPVSGAPPVTGASDTRGAAATAVKHLWFGADGSGTLRVTQVGRQLAATSDIGASDESPAGSSGVGGRSRATIDEEYRGCAELMMEAAAACLSRPYVASAIAAGRHDTVEGTVADEALALASGLRARWRDLPFAHDDADLFLGLNVANLASAQGLRWAKLHAAYPNFVPQLSPLVSLISTSSDVHKFFKQPGEPGVAARSRVHNGVVVPMLLLPHDLSVQRQGCRVLSGLCDASPDFLKAFAGAAGGSTRAAGARRSSMDAHEAARMLADASRALLRAMRTFRRDPVIQHEAAVALGFMAPAMNIETAKEARVMTKHAQHLFEAKASVDPSAVAIRKVVEHAVDATQHAKDGGCSVQ